MKRIHLDNMRHWFWIMLLIFSVILIFIGSFELIEFENSKIIKKIGAFGFLLFAVYFSRMFWHKNFVQWNKKGALIKINSFMGKSLSFDQIKMSELNEKNLIITKVNGNKVTFDLNEIAENDSQKLHEIILKNATNTLTGT